jgi:uncharacterized protein
LLARVSGISEGLAAAVVARRDEAGPFRSRQALKDVPRLGPKAFEQCAGFLRIPGGDDPLDASSVHPEAYPVVRRILRAAGTGVPGLIGNTPLLRSLRPQDFTDDRFGLPTVTDILSELEKPGRDPRPAFTTASFAEGVETLEDLAPGMVLEGVVTNVAAFGAFVDIGVHQDGLVHVSAMSRTFVSDPHQVVKSGDVVRVRVLGVDIPRKRISLTLRLDDDAPGGRPGKGQAAGAGASGGGGQGRGPAPRDQAGPAPGSGERAVGRDQAGRDQDRRGQGQGRRDQGGRGQGGRDQGGRGQGGQGQGQGRRDQGGGDRGGRDQGQRGAGPGDGAMADALRRAGLVSDQPGAGRDTGRRR